MWVGEKNEKKRKKEESVIVSVSNVCDEIL
jgi:hypothetical protein